MMANGKPLAAETMVVEPGAPRISTSPLANAPIAALPAGDDHQIDVQPILLEQPGIFGDPQRNPAAGNRSV
jgi:hypothetical protein